MELYINNIKMPTPAASGVTISRNKVWSSDSGRLEATGTMTGTLVAIKWKIEIKWPLLTQEQVATIESAVSSSTGFIPVTFYDMAGNTKTITAYCGDISYTQMSWADGFRYLSDVSVSCIEV